MYNVASVSHLILMPGAGARARAGISTAAGPRVAVAAYSVPAYGPVSALHLSAMPAPAALGEASTNKRAWEVGTVVL